MPQYRTFNRTSPGPGSGIGVSRTVMVRWASKKTARIVCPTGGILYSRPPMASPELENEHGGILAARALSAAGVHTIFALPGGHVLPLFEGARVEGLRLIDTRHEENAVFMAEGWALATGEPGFAAVTAGPGLANAFPGIAEANAAGAPVVLIAGRTGLHQRGRGA